jgi:hypothetical protein
MSQDWFVSRLNVRLKHFWNNGQCFFFSRSTKTSIETRIFTVEQQMRFASLLKFLAYCWFPTVWKKLTIFRQCSFLHPDSCLLLFQQAGQEGILYTVYLGRDFIFKNWRIWSTKSGRSTSRLRYSLGILRFEACQFFVQMRKSYFVSGHYIRLLN